MSFAAIPCDKPPLDLGTSPLKILSQLPPDLSTLGKIHSASLGVRPVWVQIPPFYWAQRPETGTSSSLDLSVWFLPCLQLVLTCNRY